MTDEQLSDALADIDTVIDLHANPLIESLEAAITVENGQDLMANLEDAILNSKNAVAALIDLRNEIRHYL